MRERYATPRALENALRSRASTEARRIGVRPGDLVERFYYQRLLVRVFQEPGWMLKGGQALLVRYGGQARASRDADLFRPVTGDIHEAVAALERAAGLDLDDYFRFTMASAEVDGNGAKIQLGVTIGAAAKSPLGVDLVVRREPIGQPTPVQMVPAVPIDWPDDWPQAILYPVVDHVTDKIAAMYELHRRQDGSLVPSTRFRDLGDLLLLSQQESFDGRTVQSALMSEVRRRNAHPSIVLELPTAFAVPDEESWRRGYPKEAEQITGLRGCRTLAEAVAAAGPFITPLLSGVDPGVWDPGSASWIARGS